MKKLDFDLKNNPFINFQSARYAMSARVNVEKLWKWCHENDKSFYVMSMGCILNAVNSVPQLKRRILNDEAIEHDYLDGVTPIMDEDKGIYREMRVRVPQEFDDILQWHDYVREEISEVLSGNDGGFICEMEERDYTNIVNLSCIPWVDFDMLTNCTVDGGAIQPLVTWGKVNDNYEMSISITVSHIFVNGRELGYFYENAQKEFNNDLFD